MFICSSMEMLSSRSWTNSVEGEKGQSECLWCRVPNVEANQPTMNESSRRTVTHEVSV